MCIKNSLLLILLLSILCFSCASLTPEKEYFTISGKINNFSGESISFEDYREYSKNIHVGPDGVFSDTMKLPQSQLFYLIIGNEVFRTFARNGLEIQIETDAGDVNNTIEISGDGSENLRYLHSALNNTEASLFNSPDSSEFVLDRAVLHDLLKKEKNVLLEKIPDLGDTIYFHAIDDLSDDFINFNLKRYDEHFFYFTTIGEGVTSPEFFNYANSVGGLTSLKDLQGKYVYIDIWATWCKPCIAEFPYIANLKKEYKGKNIEFVGLSINKQKNKNLWLEMVKSEDLKGLQLLADKDYESEFIKAYKVLGIPRFILIDPEGKIVRSKAPRPSYSKEIRALFDGLSNF